MPKPFVGLLRDRLQRVAEGDHVVGRLQRGRMAEVDLVLSGGDLVVGGVHLDAQGLQRRHHRLAHVDAAVGGEVEVAAAVVGQRLQRPGDVVAQQEELDLGPAPVLEVHLPGHLDGPAQGAAGVARVGLAVRGVGPADQPRRRRRCPGQDPERLQVGHQEHVALGGAGEGLHRGAVEPGAVLDGVGQLLGGDGHVLHRAHDVGELQVDVTGARGLRLRELVVGHVSGRCASGHVSPNPLRDLMCLGRRAQATWYLGDGTRASRRVART
jgi:hypothetical protein